MKKTGIVFSFPENIHENVIGQQQILVMAHIFSAIIEQFQKRIKSGKIVLVFGSEKSFNDLSYLFT